MPAPQPIWPLARGLLETNYASTIGSLIQGLSTQSWQLNPNAPSPSLKQLRLHWDCCKLAGSLQLWIPKAIILHSHCPGFLQVGKSRPCISNKKWSGIWKTLCYCLFSSLVFCHQLCKASAMRSEEELLWLLLIPPSLSLCLSLSLCSPSENREGERLHG